MIEEEGLQISEAPAKSLRKSRDKPQNSLLLVEKRRHSFRRKSTITTNSDDRFFDSFIDNEFTLIEQNSKDSICFEDAEELAPNKTKTSRTVKFECVQETRLLQDLNVSANRVGGKVQLKQKTCQVLNARKGPRADEESENVIPSKQVDLLADLGEYDSTSFCSNRPLNFSSVSESAGSTLNSLAKSKV